MDPTTLLQFSSQNLKACTSNFNENNLIGLTQFGRLFRGNLEGQRVLVKIWDREKLEWISSKYNDEYLIMKARGSKVLDKSNIGRLPQLGDLDWLYLGDRYSLNWVQITNVIHELAKLLNFIHDQKQNMVLNISASHTLLDKDYKPQLFDLLLLGEVKMLKEELTMSTSYIDPYFSIKGGEWDRSSEVFSLGIVMLQLITKRISGIRKRKDGNLNLDSLMHIWAKNEYKPNCSLVHKTLKEDWCYCAEDGVAITLLAMQCIEFFPANRPSMRDVLHSLDNLSVLQRLPDARPTKREK
ncbi:cysteine-rich receptor-like protein kinase 18 [Abrus precatorius]|uniref:Cysteine-rich receptor-like protein kinase 18 n=1 Tax=Abrus precatorius TaxID=3816 RepID=A0A8B8K0P7_ABRPR|nr:cysteine-rich receptor-like protein kinase 18 [Abrus precatorius]